MVLAAVYKFVECFRCGSTENPLHRLLQKANKLSHLEFRRYIALCLLKADQPRERDRGSSAGLPADARFDGHNHLLAGA